MNWKAKPTQPCWFTFSNRQGQTMVLIWMNYCHKLMIVSEPTFHYFPWVSSQMDWHPSLTLGCWAGTGLCTMGRPSEAQLAESSCQWMNDALIIIKKKRVNMRQFFRHLLAHSSCQWMNDTLIIIFLRRVNMRQILPLMYLQLDKVHTEELAGQSEPMATSSTPSIHWKPFYDSVVDEP